MDQPCNRLGFQYSCTFCREDFEVCICRRTRHFLRGSSESFPASPSIDTSPFVLSSVPRSPFSLFFVLFLVHNDLLSATPRPVRALGRGQQLRVGAFHPKRQAEGATVVARVACEEGDQHGQERGEGREGGRKGQGGRLEKT